MTLLGWSVEQFAKAAAWYASHVGPLPAADLAGAMTVRYAWLEQRLDEPTVGLIAGIEERIDYAWAWDAFSEAARKIEPYMVPA